ncbi:MAG: hypothetical protein IID40_11105 [Planctomycetes bacterium]|nr:hypothetical protein [Planctomycetota bacterium]
MSRSHRTGQPRHHLRWLKALEQGESIFDRVDFFGRRQHIRAVNGLDAPVKREITGKDGGPLQFQTVAEAIKAAAEAERAGGD